MTQRHEQRPEPPGWRPARDRDGFTIRAATPDDLDVLLAFRLAMLADISESEQGIRTVPPGELRESNARWLDAHLGRDLVAFLAESSGTAVACAGLLWFDHPPGMKNPAGVEGYIVNVYTRPEWRGRGAARLLVARAVEEARTRGAGRIWLRTSAEARRLYESLGFREGNYLELPRREG